jgi:protein SCO1
MNPLAAVQSVSERNTASGGVTAAPRAKRIALTLAAMAIGVLALLPVSSARAQVQDYFPGSHMPGGPTNFHPPILNSVGIDQNLGAQVSPDLQFVDSTGQAVKMGDYFGKRPIVLALVYYHCPMLCTMVLNDMLRSFKSMPMSVGQDFDVVTVSFDPTETSAMAAAKKATYLKAYNRAGADAGWHFLTGTQENIAALAKTVGFRYTWDASTQQYAHASGIMFLTPTGVVSKYIYGIDYAPEDIRAAVTTAAGNTVGEATTETVLLYCFCYNPMTGKYGIIVSRALRVSGTLLLLSLGTFMFIMFRRDHLAGDTGKGFTVDGEPRGDGNWAETPRM